tara:strand:+ start:5223 stop:5486 length:264 start_codon:yes stop_codon:yes gene_type:complete
MKVTRRQLRKLIKEVLLLEQLDDGTGDSAIRAFIVDELLADEDELTREDIIQQAEGAGFDSKEVEEVLDVLLETEVLEEKEEFIVVV